MAAIRSDQAKAHRGAVRTRVTAVADRAAYAAGPAGSPGSRAVVVAGLCKSYGAVRAVRGVSFAVGRGEVFALLGPNGAGKTTTLEILEGFRALDQLTVDRPSHPGGTIVPSPSRQRFHPAWAPSSDADLVPRS